MQVGGDGHRLVGFEQLVERGELKEGDDLVYCHESVVSNAGNAEVLAHGPDPRRFSRPELRVVIGEEFQIRAFARATGSVKNKEAFSLERPIGQTKKVVKGVGLARLALHAS